jgi:DUF4097 and DUF4098 domain-containing protein YvlB
MTPIAASEGARLSQKGMKGAHCMIRQLILAIPALAILALAVLTVNTASSVAFAADPGISKVMGSIDISDGQHAGDLSTVNGAIHVGENAVVGRANTVNGAITLGRQSAATELQTVNGSISVSDGARVTGPVHSVNGSLRVENGADVTGTLGNVNGGIWVAAAHVGGRIDSATGDVDIGPKAQVDGGIFMGRDTSWFHWGFEHTPRVVIGPGAVVKGPLRFERRVALYVSDRATIGPVEGAAPVKFSGDHPP